MPLNLLAKAPHHSPIDLARVKVWSELKDVNMGDYLSIPEVTLDLISMKSSDLPKELRVGKDYDRLDKIFKLQADDEFEKAYIEADKFVSRDKGSTLSEWVQFYKADLLFFVEENKDKKKYNLALEEYQDAVSRYPLNPQVPRALYQMALLQLKMQFFTEVNALASRGLKEFEGSEYEPLYRLLDAEQAFLSKDDRKATFDFAAIIQKFPHHRAAVDAAFRKAFILFRRGDFKNALAMYEDLDRYHSEEVDRLKMKTEASSSDKFVDRVFYAETVYLNQKYVEAAKLFQDLANLFPSNPHAPFLLLRLADTYLWRGQAHAAQELYIHVLEKSDKNSVAAASARLRLADLYFLTNDFNTSRKNEDLYQKAYDAATKAGNTALASLALAKLAAFHLYFKTYPKAQEVLGEYRTQFKDSANQAWVEEQFTKTVELQILDYYRREDFLAALSTYLVFERDQTNHFQNTQALLKIADAANRLSLYDKAAQILNRVIYLEKTSEGRQEALLKLVDILIVQGELRKASERLRRFAFAYPTTPLRYLYEMYWGQLYSALKNHAQASNHYEKALQSTRAEPAKLFEIRFTYIKLAEESEKLSLPGKAVESYEKYAKLVRDIQNNPLSEWVITKKDKFLMKFSRYRIADTYYAMHDFVKALDAYKIVSKEVQEEPFLSHSLYRIGECYLALNDRKAALNAFASVQSKDPKNIWAKAAQSYIASVQMEVKYGIRILN